MLLLSLGAGRDRSGLDSARAHISSMSRLRDLEALRLRKEQRRGQLAQGWIGSPTMIMDSNRGSITATPSGLHQVRDAVVHIQKIQIMDSEGTLADLVHPGFYDEIVLIGFPHDEGARRAGLRNGANLGPDSFRRFLGAAGQLYNI